MDTFLYFALLSCFLYCTIGYVPTKYYHICSHEVLSHIIQLDSCLRCNQILHNYAVKCDLCEAFFHKRAKITPQQIRLIRCNNINYRCTSCYEVFHFKILVMMKLYLKILLLKSIMTFIN